ncbi:MAG: sensor histidine kinase [Sarcina sp.]
MKFTNGSLKNKFKKQQDNHKLLLIMSGLSLYSYISTNHNKIFSPLLILLWILFIINLISALINNRNIFILTVYITLIPVTIIGMLNFPIIVSYFYCVGGISFFIRDKIHSKILFVLAVLSYITSFVFYNAPYTSFMELFKTLFDYLAPYIASMLFVTILVLRKKNKVTVYEMNKELKAQNEKLQDYAQKLEEMTILNERTRVAQELHDSLGHYLMAISMHLDILDKINKDDKVSTVIQKTKILTKDGISELRKTVFELKELKDSNILSTSIESLTKNLSTLNEIEFNVDIDEKIEKFSPFIKDIIYKTVQEAITNGIKHGHANKFMINISISDKIRFSIENNGSTPKDILKSNGLKGIEERLSLARGDVKFISENGFKIICSIPIEEIINTTKEKER